MPQHILFAGTSQSGKTTLARYFARKLRAANKRVVVYDPVGTATLGGDWGDGAEIYDDDYEFLSAVEDPTKIHDAHLFVDEADEIFAHSMRGNFWIAKKGRHYGLSVYAISQRPTMIHPTVRNQMTRGYIFRLALEDCKNIAADYGHSNVHKIQLLHGDFLSLRAGHPDITRGNVFKLMSESGV